MAPDQVAPSVKSEGAEKLERYATIVLIVLNIAFFAYELWLKHGSPLRRYQFEQTHALSLHGFRQGAWWQLITFQFLHGGWIHLLMNLLLLHSLGPVMETTLGRWRFLVLYLVSGSVGGVLQLIGAWSSPVYFGASVVGASAGLCGLLASLAAVYSEERLRLLIFFIFPMEVRAKFVLLFAALLSAVGAVFAVGTIAHLAHLGGLIGGLWCINWWKIEPILVSAPASPSPLPSRNLR